MRAAHLQSIDKLEFQKTNLASFKRFIEKVRTTLFDLNRIGETAVADLIKRICLKLLLEDRISWNFDKGSGLEHRSLNQFGSWLCNRTTAYQNAYSNASEQYAASSSRQRDKHQARSHQTSSTSSSNNKGKNTKRQPYCFKCEGEHRLDDCNGFNNLSVGERVTFCVRHKLCFSCLGTRHFSRDCAFRRSVDD